MFNSISSLKCNLLLLRGENPSHAEWYKDYVESVLSGVYKLDIVLPEAENSKAINTWNSVIESLENNKLYGVNKYDLYLFVVNGRIAKLSDILESIVSDYHTKEEKENDKEEKENEYIKFFSEKTGKDYNTIKTLTDKFIASNTNDKEYNYKSFLDIIKKDIGLVINSNDKITAANTDIVMEDEESNNNKKSVEETPRPQATTAIPEQPKVERIDPFELLKTANVSIPIPPMMPQQQATNPYYNEMQRMNFVINDLKNNLKLSPEQAKSVINIFGQTGYTDYMGYITKFKTPIPVPELVMNYFITKPIMDKNNQPYSEEYCICHNAPRMLHSHGVPIRGTFEIEKGDRNNLILVDEFGDRIHYIANESVTYTDNAGNNLTFLLDIQEVKEEDATQNPEAEKQELPKQDAKTDSNATQNPEAENQEVSKQDTKTDSNTTQNPEASKNVETTQEAPKQDVKTDSNATQNPEASKNVETTQEAPKQQKTTGKKGGNKKQKKEESSEEKPVEETANNTTK